MQENFNKINKCRPPPPWILSSYKFFKKKKKMFFLAFFFILTVHAAPGPLDVGSPDLMQTNEVQHSNWVQYMKTADIPVPTEVSNWGRKVEDLLDEHDLIDAFVKDFPIRQYASYLKKLYPAHIIPVEVLDSYIAAISNRNLFDLDEDEFGEQVHEDQAVLEFEKEASPTSSNQAIGYYFASPVIATATQESLVEVSFIPTTLALQTAS